MKRKYVRNGIEVMSVKEYCQRELEAYRKFSKGTTALEFKEWFVKNATLFKTVDRTLSEQLSERHNCKVKECYHNTWNILIVHADLKYYEGYTFSNRIPLAIDHSWLVTTDGKVIDPTLIINGNRFVKQMKKYYRLTKSEINIEKRKSEDRIADEYFGIEIPLKYIHKKAIQKKMTGAFLLDCFIDNLDKFVEIKV